MEERRAPMRRPAPKSSYTRGIDHPTTGIMHGARTAAALGLAVLLCAQPAVGQTLRGSKTTMIRQNRVAQDHDYTFLRNDAHVRKFVSLDLLEPVRGNANYELASVSYPYARPALKLFIERLAAQYRSACGEKLVVTSLTRPLDEQPRNASDLSVHPTGMAVDLRVSNRSKCRSWLEGTLLSLEKTGVLDAIRERRPPHYHVALYPTQYVAYVQRMTGNSARLASNTPSPAPKQAEEAPVMVAADVDVEVDADAGDAGSGEALTSIDYRVNRGETLWSIARRHGVTVNDIRSINGLRGSRIDPGQVLSIPVPAAQQR